MKNILASVGIGNASVDTVLPSETVQPGETVDAEVHVAGGNVEQEVGTIRFEIETQYVTDEGYREVDIDRFTLAEGLTIEPDQEETRQVAIDVPYETPITVGNAEVWIETELDIDRAVDPEDKDYLDVRPTARLQAAFDAMEALGFSMHTSEVEGTGHGHYGGGRFVQEFEFRARSGPFAGDLDEVELIANPGPDALELYVEIDRKGGLLGEMTDTDERKTSVTVTSTDVDEVHDQLEAAIERHA